MEAVSGLIVLFVTITMVMILPLIIAAIMLLLLSLLSACVTARPHGRVVFSCRGIRGKNSDCPEEAACGGFFLRPFNTSASTPPRWRAA